MKKREIFRLLLSNQEYSQAELSRMLGYSKAAVQSLVNELKDEELIEEKGDGKSKSVGGKKPRILGIREKGVYMFTVAGEYSKHSFFHPEVSLINLKGEKKDSGHVHLPEDGSPQEILEPLILEINRQKNNLLAEEPRAKIIASAISVGGRVDPVGGKLIESSGRLKKLVGVPITEMIESRTGIRTLMEDAVVFPAYREYFLGAAAGYKSFAYLDVLPFVRAILFLNGSLYLGSRFLAGEIGGSIGVMGERENEYLCDLFDHEIFGLPLIKDRLSTPVDCNIVYDFHERAKRGALLNGKLEFERLARLTGQVVVNMLCYIDMPFIVLGGVPESVKEDFYAGLIGEVERHISVGKLEDFEIRFAENKKSDDGMLGFVCFAADNMFC